MNLEDPGTGQMSFQSEKINQQRREFSSMPQFVWLLHVSLAQTHTCRPGAPSSPGGPGGPKAIAPLGPRATEVPGMPGGPGSPGGPGGPGTPWIGTL